jgi:hypothetical protein
MKKSEGVSGNSARAQPSIAGDTYEFSLFSLSPSSPPWGNKGSIGALNMEKEMQSE